jgi:hypothetical protein
VTGVAVLLSTLALSSGVHGIVTRGPIMPVCKVGEPCSAPAPDVVLTFVRGDRRFSVRTDGTGHYRIALPAGAYLVRARGTLGLRPASVVVPADRNVLRNFSIDTGIR